MRRAVAAIAIAAAVLNATAAKAGHQFAHGEQSAGAAKRFASDFTPIKDSEWGFDVGGFGGETRGKKLNFNPIVFVHGNGVDATFWDIATEVPPSTLNVRNYFRARGYSDQELWGLSYNGSGCSNTVTCGTANDINVPDVYGFIEAVRAYTGSKKVDVVAHSLGVTVVRKAMKLHPELLGEIEDIVLIAGANHGTTPCRGQETFWFGCDEVVPGSPWLADLNSWNPVGEGDETPGPLVYMTIFEGTGTTDTFFGKSATYDDSKSPALAGAINHEIQFEAHLPLARGQSALDTYSLFLATNNTVIQSAPTTQGVPGNNGAAASGGSLAATGSSSANGGAALTLLGLALLGAMSVRRRPRF